MRARSFLAQVLVLAVSAWLGWSAGTRAEPARFHDVLLDLPAAGQGWQRQEGADGILLQKSFPRDEQSGRRRAGGALIQVLKPVAASPGSLAANLAEFVRMLPEMAGKKPTVRASGVTVNGHPILVERRCCAERQEVGFDAIHVGIAAPERQVFLALVAMELDDAAEDEVEAEFEALVRSLRPGPDDRPFELVPPQDGGGLDGLYTWLDVGIRPNVFGGTDFYSESRVMAFDPSGLFSEEIPEGPDIASHCRENPRDCGTYRLAGGGLFGASEIELLEVSSDYGIFEAETKPFARDGADLEIDGTAYHYVPPLPRGTPFEGVWHYTYASSGTMAFSSGGVAVERTLTMTRSGAFTRTGSSGVMSSNEAGDTRTSVAGSHSRPIEHGRYEVEGYQLILTGEDGRVERLSLFKPTESSDELLVINGGNYLKK